MDKYDSLKDALLEVLHVIHHDGFYNDSEAIIQVLQQVEVPQREIDLHLRW